MKCSIFLFISFFPVSPFSMSLRQRLLSGGRSYGPLILSDSPVVALTGYGHIVIDHEHSPTDIKSGQNFLALQSALEGTENRIGVSRRDYIEAVRVYNTELNTIPGRWWKSFMYPASKEMASFDIPAEEQKTPKVDFDTKK